MNFSHESHKEHSFDAFCKKVLKNEAINIQRRMKRERDKYVSLSYLLQSEIAALSHYDEYEIDYEIFSILEYEISVKHDILAESMKKISKKRQAIVLLSYFFEMNDREIAEALNLLQGSVCYHRKQALKELKERIENLINE